MPHEVFLNRIGTALPPYEAHAAFLHWAEAQVTDWRERVLFQRLVARCGIERRWTVLAPPDGGGDQSAAGGFYEAGMMPPTSERMEIYARSAPDLCVEAAGRLGALGEVTHLVLASCTGFTAPGVDQVVARRLGLASTVERTVVGFMGCYAAVVALRTARHIVRSEPGARVLVLAVELCTLHLQPGAGLEAILAMMLFGDGAAAALVSAAPEGLAMGRGFAATLPDSDGLIGWRIGDSGFAMHLSGAVPARIASALADGAFRERIQVEGAVDSWAVHAGGRTVLDAVEQGMTLGPDALEYSRAVLRECGNMSSATLMFVLQRILAGERPIGHGIAIAFGPGVAAEGFEYRRAA